MGPHTPPVEDPLSKVKTGTAQLGSLDPGASACAQLSVLAGAVLSDSDASVMVMRDNGTGRT